MKKHHFKKTHARSLLFLLLLSLFLTPCVLLKPQSTGEPQSTKEVSISYSEIKQSVGLEVGDILEVVLPANPSTGYIWEVGFYNQTVLKPFGEPEFYKTSTNLGAQETQKLHFEAIDEGETELVLLYRRSLENEVKDQQTFGVQVEKENSK